MPTLERALIDYDENLIAVIAAMWDIDLPGEGHIQDVEYLAGAMSDSEAAAAMWEHLGPEEQAALLDLQSTDGRQPAARFFRQYGEIRQMGFARREREKPRLNPASVAEALYYRGLIVFIFMRDPTGTQEYAVIPGVLPDLLPQPEPVVITPGRAVDVPPRVVPGGLSTAVNDMATLLAVLYIRDYAARDWLLPEPQPAIDPYLRRSDPLYRALLVQLAYELQFVNSRADGITQVDREVVRPWLENSHDNQARLLIDQWTRSTGWNMLAHTPGLIRGEIGWPNDPRLARQALMDAMRHIPAEMWWSVDSLLAFIREDNPDFQRPGGDYTAWYLRDTVSGAILHCFEMWTRIVGAQLRAIIEGPVRWLGLATAAGGALRLTDHGLAWLERSDWPTEPDPEPAIVVDPHGIITVPATLSRYDRTQIARFTTWLSTPEAAAYIEDMPPADEGAYQYQLTVQSIRRVSDRGITPERIHSFLERLARSDLPESVAGTLANWSPDAVTIRDAAVLAVKDPVLLERIRRDARVTRLLRQEIGPRSYRVRRDQAEALASMLRTSGIMPFREDHAEDDRP
ncbi:MAG: helicase-associated domain-containing protein [Anaerolineae bacterium]